MPNQTPHTPQTHQKMKPITIPPEMQDLVKKINELASTVIPELEKSEEENRKKELEKQQEFIEINGIRLETENLGKPTHPDIQILNKGDETKEGIPYCWKNGDDWYYNWHAAMLEAKHLGKKLPKDEELTQLFGSDKDIELTEQEFKELMKKLNLKLVGNRNASVFVNSGLNLGLWTSTRSENDRIYGRLFHSESTSIIRNSWNRHKRGFSVRCIFTEKKENMISEKEELILKLRRKNFLKRIKSKVIEKLIKKNTKT